MLREEEILKDAIRYVAGSEHVFLRFRELENVSSNNAGRNELLLQTNKSGQSFFRYGVPRNSRIVAHHLRSIMRAAANHAGCVIVENLYDILTRCGPPFNYCPENVIDATMVMSFIDGQNTTDLESLASRDGKSIIEYVLDRYSDIGKVARRFHRACHVPMIKAYAQASENKIFGVYEGIPREYRVYYNIYGAKTGRMVTKGSALGDRSVLAAHMVAKKIRSNLVRARENHKIVMVDYVSAEIRTIAAISEDKSLSKLLAKDIDPYAFLVHVAGQENLDRSHGKAILIDSYYGASVASIAEDLEISVQQTKKVLGKAQELFPESYDLMNWIAERSVDDGSIRTPTGRVFFCEDKEKARRQMPNRMVQSVTADANNLIFAELVRGCKRARPIIHIHDGYVLEVPERYLDEELDLIQEIVETNPLEDFGVPLSLRCTIDVDDAWRP